MDDWDNNMISLFDVFELKLLHSSYIKFLRNYQTDKLKDEVEETDRKRFVAVIEAMAAAME